MGENPRDIEVRSQLEKILRSRHFITAGKQSKILRLVVEKALSGEEIKGVDLKTEMGGVFDSDSHKDRAGAWLVRQKIKHYYDNEGRDDIVRISLPPGPAYRPTFSYNVKAEAIRSYQRALSYEGRISAFALSEAEFLLRKAIKFSPEHAPLYEAQAEIFLLRLLLDNVLGMYPLTSGWMQLARESAENAVRVNPASSAGHLLLGIVWLLVYQGDAAKREISVAIEADPRTTKASLWYAAYLMTIGKIDEGLQIAESKAKDHPGSFEIHLVYAFFLYATRSYKRATNTVFEVAGIEAGSTLQEFLKFLIDMAVGGEPEDVALRLRSISTKMSEQWDRPTTFLNLRSEQHGEVPWNGGISFPNVPNFKVEGSKRGTLIRWNQKYDPGERFPGLLVMALGCTGRIDEAKEKMKILRKQRSVRSLQLVLAYMGVGDQGRALGALRRSLKEGDIFAHWASLLPLFDPLRNHPRFQESMGLIKECDSA